MKTKFFTLLFAVVANIGVASAAITVRLNTQNCSNWATVYLWAQTSDGEVLFSYPGAEVNQDVEGWYSYTFEENVSEVNIIWRGNSGNYSLSSDKIYYVKESTDYILNDCGTYYEPNVSVNIVGLPANVVTGLFQFGDLYYKIDGKMAEVTSHKEDWDNYRGLEYVSIPSSVSYNGVNYPVKQIEEYAFGNSYELKTITIPNSVTYIGKSAFAGTGIKTITLPNSITRIEDELFRGSGLESITIPNSVTSIGEEAFAYCDSLVSVNIPNSVTHIGYGAFYECDSLLSAPLPNSIRHLGGDIFHGCKNLTSTNIPEYIDSVCRGMFYACQKLESISIPNNAKYIGAEAFNYCSSLKSIQIPDKVTFIGSQAFYGSGLKSIVIPMQIDSIFTSAFCQCDSLSSVIWNAKKTGIWAIDYYGRCVPSNYLFDNCPMLSSLTVGEDVDSLPYFWGGVYFESDSLKSVTWNAKHCEIRYHLPLNVQEITFGNKVEYIPSEICYMNHGIKQVIIPNSVKSIGNEAFACDSITKVIIGDGLTFAGHEAFQKFNGRISSITCYTKTPPQMGDNWGDEGLAFNTDTMFVPAESVNAYKNAYKWRQWRKLLPIGATSVQTDDIYVTPSENYAEILWKAITNAATYELYIEIAGVRWVWTFVFDAEGLLISMVSHAPARNHAPRQTQSAGFSYVVMGLDGGTTYNATIIAKDNNGNTIDTQTTSFTTTGNAPLGIEDIETDEVKNVKVIRDGKVYLLRGEKVYTIQGQEVK